MLARILSIVGLVSAGLLLILLTTTTPSMVGAPGILAVFILIYATILCGLTFLLWVGFKLIRPLRLFRQSAVFSLRQSYYYASVLALGPVIIISLQAVGGVGLYEIGLVCLFLALGCLYVSRRIA